LSRRRNNVAEFDNGILLALDRGKAERSFPRYRT